MNNLTKNSKIQSVGKFINRHYAAIMVCLLCTMMIGTTVFAAAGADVLWTNLTTLIEKWVTRLGGVAIFVGGVLFGLGWMQNDSREKIAGVSTIIAGGIVIAVAQLAGTFFA